MENLKQILDAHLKWVNNEKGGVRANLIDAILRGAYLEYTCLIDANLRGANLKGADLRGANLTCANLKYANLESANLEGANLEGANLVGANLRFANLGFANLESANLESANLKGANLPMFCKWEFSVIDGKIQIGCKTKSIKDWEAFFNSNKVYSTLRHNPEFKQIKAVYLANKAYLEALK